MKKIIFTGLMVMLATLSAAVYAGQGGIAGSSSMIMNAGGIVTDVATSIAIGKSSAHSNADTTSTTVKSYAGGGAGLLTISSGALTEISVEDGTNLVIDQSNAMTTGTVSLDAKAGTFAGQASTAAP